VSKIRGFPLALILLLSALWLGIFLLWGKIGEGNSGFPALAQAQSAAQAAVDAAIFKLKIDRNWEKGFRGELLPHSQARYSLTFDSRQGEIPYSTNNLNHDRAVNGWGGRIVPPHSAHLVGLGQKGAQKWKEETILVLSLNPFPDLLLAKEQLSLTGDFRLFARGQGEANGKPAARAAVYSGAPGALSAEGKIRLEGDLITAPAPEGNALKLGGNVRFKDYLVRLPGKMPCISPAYGKSQGDLELGAGQTFRLKPEIYSKVILKTGSAAYLEAGEYIFESLEIGEKARLIGPPKGKVSVFVLQNAECANPFGLENRCGSPGDLVLLSYKHGQKLAFSKGLCGSLAIYAPESVVTVTGPVDFYGAVSARRIIIEGRGVWRYDPALKELSMGRRTVLRSRW